METKESKYAELDEYLKEEVFPDDLVKELTELREQCITVFMNVLIYQPNIRVDISEDTNGYLYNLKRLIEIFSNIKKNN